MFIEKLIPENAIKVEIRNLGSDDREIIFMFNDELEEIFS